MPPKKPAKSNQQPNQQNNPPSPQDLSALMQALGNPGVEQRRLVSDETDSDRLSSSSVTSENPETSPKRVQDHPDWAAFKEQPFPARINLYYPNPQGKEFYWENVRVIKLDLARCQLIGEGHHGDPIRFDIAKMVTPRHAQTGASLQGLFGDLVRMWQEVQMPE
jgi:hypothetical protein